MEKELEKLRALKRKLDLGKGLRTPKRDSVPSTDTKHSQKYVPLRGILERDHGVTVARSTRRPSTENKDSNKVTFLYRPPQQERKKHSASSSEESDQDTATEVTRNHSTESLPKKKHIYQMKDESSMGIEDLNEMMETCSQTYQQMLNRSDTKHNLV